MSISGGERLADLDDRIRALERQLAEAQAQMGAMREALEYADRWRYGHVHGSRPGVCGDCQAIAKVTAALAPEAGKELLARLEKAEADLRLSEEFDQDWDEAAAKVRAAALEEAVKVVKSPREAGRIRALAESTSPDVAK